MWHENVRFVGSFCHQGYDRIVVAQINVTDDHKLLYSHVRTILMILYVTSYHELFSVRLLGFAFLTYLSMITGWT